MFCSPHSTWPLSWTLETPLHWLSPPHSTLLSSGTQHKMLELLRVQYWASFSFYKLFWTIFVNACNFVDVPSICSIPKSPELTYLVWASVVCRTTPCGGIPWFTGIPWFQVVLSSFSVFVGFMVMLQIISLILVYSFCGTKYSIWKQYNYSIKVNQFLWTSDVLRKI